MRECYVSAISVIVMIFISWSSVDCLSVSEARSGLVHDTVFSATRAFRHLNTIAQQPHSIGTREHTLVRDYLISEYHQLGIPVKVQTAISKRLIGQRLVVAKIHNVVARIEGASSNNAVLVVAHYDSHPNTPGAGDNAAGVATVLEVARVLKCLAQPRNDIILLFTDAEEVGLLGAKAFSETSDFDAVRLVINLEGRGNRGPSTMFEVNSDNGWVIKEYARGAVYPFANSLSFEIYQHLPNDTDYTIFKGKNVAGLNQAFIGGLVNYHSMTDTPANLSLNTVQQQGDNTLGLVKHFGNIDLNSTKSPDVSYFNLGPVFITYPAGWNLYFVFVQVFLLSALIFLGISKNKASIKGIFVAFIVFLASIFLSCTATWLFLKVLKWLYPLYENFYASNSYNSEFYFFAIAIINILVAAQGVVWVLARFTHLCLAIGTQVAMTVILIFLYIVAPTATYLFFVPCIFAILFQIWWLLSAGKKRQLSTWFYYAMIFISCLPAVLLLSPMIFQVFIVFGLSSRVTLCTLMLVPLVFVTAPLYIHSIKAFRYQTILTSILIVTILFAHIQSAFSPTSPLQTYILYEFDADKRSARWVLPRGQIDAGNRRFFEPPQQNTERNGVVFTGAPLYPISIPEMEVLNDTTIEGFRTLNLYYRRAEDCTFSSFALGEKGSISKLFVNEQELLVGEEAASVSVIDFFGLPNEGVTLTLQLTASNIDFWIAEFIIGLSRICEDPCYPAGSIPGPGYESNTIMVKKHLAL